jgi:SPP1 family phage portal protein
MEEILELLKSDPKKAIELLKSQGKKQDEIKKYIDEYKSVDRKIRLTQIGNVQQDKTVGTNIVDAVRIPVSFQKKIVINSVAFEVGEPVTLIPNEENKNSNIAKLIKSIWKVNRMDNKIQKLLTHKKSETQSALLFYTSIIKEGSLVQKLLTMIGFKNQKKEIKVSLLDNSKGSMYPYIDEFGDMIAFTWEFITKTSDGKDQKNTWIYTEKTVHKFTGDSTVPEVVPHDFDKIPVVYVSQDNVEWFDVQTMIDRLEVTLSKLGASNDYSGHPMLIIEGEIENAPNKDEDGKAWLIPIKKDDEGNEIKGNVRFLEAETAPESIKLELEKVEDYIHNISSTPNLSLNSLKSIGNVAEKTVKLMFLDPIIKAKTNEGDNRTMIERCINIIISGIVTTTNTNLANESKTLFFDIQFNSILPDDLSEAVENISKATNAGVMSKRTGIEMLGLVNDIDAELEIIKTETVTASTPETKI